MFIGSLPAALFGGLLLASPPCLADELAPEERADLEGAVCRPLMTALTKAMKGGKKGSVEAKQAAVLEALAKVKKPAKMAASDFEFCTKLIERDSRSVVSRTVEVEATEMLDKLAAGIKSSFEQNEKLCPSTKKPAPPELTKVASGAYVPTADDWSDPSWDCANAPDMASMRFQYSIVNKGGGFDLVAKGYPAGDGKLVTYVKSGKVSGETIKWGETERK